MKKSTKIVYALLLLSGLMITPVYQGVLYACDACNFQFASEVKHERANTLVGKELQAAMDNQRGLPLDELKAPYLLAEERQAKQATDGERVNRKTVVETSPVSVSTSPSKRVSPLPPLPLADGRTGDFPAYPHKQEPFPEYFKGHDFIEIIERDYSLDIPPTSYVPQDAPVDKSFTINLNEGKTYLGNGVVYEGFLMDGKVPGKTIIVDEGDVVEIIVKNTGTIPHGASIHAANTQTSKYLGKIGPGETKAVRFRATQPGVFMYHCAPGGHAIPMHVLFGQYGMIVVRPKQAMYELEKQLGHGPDLELYLIQNELYASGKDAVEGNPAYVVYNGKIFQYVENPIMAKPGDYVRIYYLNIGPNLISTFHIVGIIWDYAYWQGHPNVRWPGGQTVTAGPSDSWVVEFRVPPDEGAYTLLSHAVGSTSRGAIGLLVADRNANTNPQILAEGPEYTEAEMAEFVEKSQRRISPFGIGTHPSDKPVVYGPEVKEVKVSIIGNSYYPKVIQVAPGTKVTWTNEDVFAYMAGEFSGIHNVAAMEAPPNEDNVVSPLLAHGESFSHVFETEWEYNYTCTPHPYMQGKVIVKAPDYQLADAHLALEQGTGKTGRWLIALVGVCFLLSTMALARGNRSN